eukprot:6182715-Pleurochrysis_carterae.AAC.1
MRLPRANEPPPPVSLLACPDAMPARAPLPAGGATVRRTLFACAVLYSTYVTDMLPDVEQRRTPPARAQRLPYTAQRTLRQPLHDVRSGSCQHASACGELAKAPGLDASDIAVVGAFVCETNTVKRTLREC